MSNASYFCVFCPTCAYTLTRAGRQPRVRVRVRHLHLVEREVAAARNGHPRAHPRTAAERITRADVRVRQPPR